MSSHLKDMPLKNEVLEKNTFLYGGYDRETSQCNKMKEEMGKEMKISNLFCALHFYNNSEEALKWILRKLTEILDTAREYCVSVTVT